MDIYSQYFNNYLDENVEVPFPDEQAKVTSYFNYEVDQIRDIISCFIGKNIALLGSWAKDKLHMTLQHIVDYNNYCKGYTSDFPCLKDYPTDYILESFNINQYDNVFEITLMGRPVEGLRFGEFHNEILTIRMD